MALISLPVMIRYGYNMRYATGVLAASGTITQLVPPSLVLIVMADQLGRSVGDMYKGAWGPSILQVTIFELYTFGLGVFKPSHVPGIPKEARTLTGWRLWYKCLKGIIPSAILIFTVLGSMGGLPGIKVAIATPTEAGAMGCMGALILAAIHKRLSLQLIWQAMNSTMRLTAMVVFILIGSRVFSMVFQGVDGSKWVESMLTNLPGGQAGFLLVVNAFIFFLAFFLDFFEIAFIILPLLGPVANKLGIDLVWFGVLLCVNMQTSFMHPPFGFALFYLRGISDTLFKEGRIPRPIASKDIYMGAIPWVIMQLVLVVVVIFVPQSVTLFLDKEEKIDLDKVVIEMPEETNSLATDGDQNPFATPAQEGSESNSKQSDQDEQKRMEELFNIKK
jgi:tripartite ATP-independent transporter DctM subunit